MRASVGDHIVIRGHHVGEPDRDVATPDMSHCSFTSPAATVRHYDNASVRHVQERE